MMRSSVLRVAMVGVILAAPAAAVAQVQSSDNTGYGTTAAEFLLIGVNARGMALGGGYTALATDVGGLNANPGALALIKRPGIQGSQLQYVGDTKLNWAGVAMPFGGGSSALGFQIGTFGFKDQPVYTTQQPDGSGSFYSVNESFMAASLSRNFSDRFSVGVTGKAILDRLGDVNGSAFALDFGTHFHSQLAGKPVRFAFSLSNVGTSLKYSGAALRALIARTATRDTLQGQGELGSLPQQYARETTPFALPTLFRVALAYDVYGKKDAHVTVMGEFNQMRTNKPAYGGGAELGMDHVAGSAVGLALRGSYSTNPSLKFENDPDYVQPSKDKSAGLAFGGGLNITSRSGLSVGFDYAWKQIGALGNVNFYTFSLGW